MQIIALIVGIVVIAIGVFLMTNDDVEIKDNDDVVLPTETESSTTTQMTDEEQIEPVSTTTLPVSTNLEEPDTSDQVKTITKDTPTQPSNTEPAPTPTPTPVSSAKSYTSEAVYFVSNNKYIVDVTLEVKDNIVTNSDVTYGNKPTGYQHPLQERFDKVYQTQVIGKKLEDINLSRVGGASLTSKAFNEAVGNIITQANS
jgi:uncharacterized protein with FMN-binding domain